MTAQKTSVKKKPSAGAKKKPEKVENDLENKLQETKDKLLRAYADIQNIQKRMDKELASKQQQTKTQYLLKLLDIYELLQKALIDDNPKEGLEAIQKLMESFIQQEGIRVIDCVGQPFDHTCHHAICTHETKEGADNEIIEEIKKGYFCKDHLLRPAQVIVAKKKTKE